MTFASLVLSQANLNSVDEQCQLVLYTELVKRHRNGFY